MKTIKFFAAALLVSLSFSAPGQDHRPEAPVVLKDYAGEPSMLDIESYALANDNFRTVLWTGTRMQLTVMSIPVGGDVGLELHETVDQFLYVEQGEGRVEIGSRKDRPDFTREAGPDDAILVPAGKWHNLINTGNQPLKLFSVYAPVQHPSGTVHKTQADALADEHEHEH